MGLLNNWLNKKKKEQLEHAGDKQAAKVVAEKIVKEKKQDKPRAAEVPVAADQKKTASTGVAYKILIKPLVTEKSAVAQSNNKYSFVVATFATKVHVKQAI